MVTYTAVEDHIERISNSYLHRYRSAALNNNWLMRRIKTDTFHHTYKTILLLHKQARRNGTIATKHVKSRLPKFTMNTNFTFILFGENEKMGGQLSERWEVHTTSLTDNLLAKRTKTYPSISLSNGNSELTCCILYSLAICLPCADSNNEKK